MQTLVFSTLAGQLGVTRGRSLGPSPFNSNHQELSQVHGLKCTNFVVLLGLVPYSRFLVYFLSCSIRYNDLFFYNIPLILLRVLPIARS